MSDTAPSIAWRPRFWIPGYDRWSLIAPGLLGLIVALLCVLPKPPVAVVPRHRPVPPRVLAVTTILTPLPGSVFRVGHVADLEGTAEPGSLVRLYYGTQAIGQTVVAVDGRYRFGISSFPAGQHTLRAEAVVGARSQWSSEVTFTVQAAPKAATTTKAVKKKAR